MLHARLHTDTGLWGLQAEFSTNKINTWMGVGDYCILAVNATGPADVICAEPLALYTASVYWAVMTITSIGYGATRLGSVWALCHTASLCVAPVALTTNIPKYSRAVWNLQAIFQRRLATRGRWRSVL